MNELMIREMPAPERPRERLMRLGVRALSDRELLAVLLRTGKRGDSAIQVAARLLKHFQGDLTRLAEAVPEEFQRISGIGMAKAVTLMAACELGRRLNIATKGERPELKSPGAYAEYLRPHFENPNQEEFHILMLDTRNRVFGQERISTGILDQSLVHPREVFRPAIQCACHNIILCHNHPSGDPAPSDVDSLLTQRLFLAGELIGIAVQDHIILGRTENDPKGIGYYSMAAHGFFEQFKKQFKNE
ncbi:MAG: DNA repair protein RadC [Victivallales bacterium]|nr:DNA repair protein RadC [Victivallales bacterium]